jgi:hypothetical protein
LVENTTPLCWVDSPSRSDGLSPRIIECFETLQAEMYTNNPGTRTEIKLNCRSVLLSLTSFWCMLYDFHVNASGL